MANYLITGYHGEPHVTAENDRGIYAGIAGTGRYVLPVGEQFRAEYIGNNTVRLYDGKLIDNGAAAGIPAGEYIDLQIANASQGYYRNDLIVFQYKVDTSTLIENGTFLVVQGTETTGTPADPTLTQQDLLSGSATLDQMALWRVSVDGTTIGDPVKRFTLLESLKDHGHTASDISGILPVSKGGTGSSTGMTNAPANSIIKKITSDSGVGQFWYTATADGAFYATGDNASAKFGTLPVAQGGTGSTTASGARTNLGITPTNIGAAPKEHEHRAGDITSGTLRLARGGTGCSTDLVNAPGNAIIKKLKSDAYTQLYYTATGNGAFYATETNGDAMFGTLPVAQGGTGSTTASGARTNLGITPSNIGALANTGGTVSGRITSSSGGYRNTRDVDGVEHTSDYSLLSSSGKVYINHCTDGTEDNYLTLSADGTYFLKPLSVTGGGTGATTASEARTKLGLGSKSLWSGSLASSDATATITNGYGSYCAYVVMVKPNSSGDYYVPVTIPKGLIGTSAKEFIAASSDYYVTFRVYYSGTTLYVNWAGQNNNGTITNVYGLI